MIAKKTREESQIKFGMVKKRLGGGVFSFYPPKSKKRCYGPDFAININVFAT